MKIPESGSDTTHFGFKKISSREKTARVADVFSSVAGKYDLMNDLMSLGMHRGWKRFAVNQSHVKPGDSVLDVAGGSGDLTRLFLKRVGKTGRVILTDINPDMLQRGRDRLIDAGAMENVSYAQVDAEALPFAENSFDCISIGFGLRNVTHINTALKSMYRCLKPGGSLVILEFSKPLTPALQKIYDTYSFSVLPRLGRYVVNDEESYRYLVESIRMHPGQDTLKAWLENAGFERVQVNNLAGGIVALHQGFKV